MKLASTAINHLVLWISFWAIECCWRRILHLIINLLYNFSSYHGEKIIERLNRGLNRRCVICQRWNDWLSDIYERRSINRQNCRWNLDGTAHWLMLIFAFTVCSMWSCGNVHWSDNSRVRHSSKPVRNIKIQHLSRSFSYQLLKTWTTRTWILLPFPSSLFLLVIN